MNRIEIHPNTFLFYEVQEIQPSLDIQVCSDDPCEFERNFDYKSSAMSFFDMISDEMCEYFIDELFEVIKEHRRMRNKNG